MAHSNVIPLHRAATPYKLVTFVAVAARWAPLVKWPDKARELRLGRRPWSRHVVDALAGLVDLKYTYRARHRAKLRLFRVLKLIGDLKHSPAPGHYRVLGAPRKRL